MGWDSAQKMTVTRWYRVRERAFALGFVWFPLSTGIFSLSPMGVVLSHVGAELLVQCVCLWEREERRWHLDGLEVSPSCPGGKSFFLGLGFQVRSCCLSKGLMCSTWPS